MTHSVFEHWFCIIMLLFIVVVYWIPAIYKMLTMSLDRWETYDQKKLRKMREEKF